MHYCFNSQIFEQINKIVRKFNDLDGKSYPSIFLLSSHNMQVIAQYICKHGDETVFFFPHPKYLLSDINDLNGPNIECPFTFQSR